MDHHRLCDDPMCLGDCADMRDDEFWHNPSSMMTTHEAEKLADAAYQEGRSEERARIVAWLASEGFHIIASRVEGGVA